MPASPRRDPPGAVVPVGLSASPDAQVCGFGSVALADDDPFGVQHIPAGLRRAALDWADAQMLASPDEQVRAAALLIGARSREGEAVQRIDRLARLAAGTRDAAVYAMAIEGCRALRADEAGACQLLNRAQWARLDPDNAVPWLELAAEAHEQQQGSAEAEAMYRAALARRSEMPAGLLPRLVERALGGQPHSLGLTLALSASWSVQAAWSLPPADQAYRYCAGDALEQPGRQTVCAALADTLAYRGSSVLDLAVAAALAHQLHWPEQRLRALQHERDALSDASRFQAAALDLSCESVDRLQGWMQRLGQGGELQAARALVLASGTPIEEWSRQHRVNIELATATAQAVAASAAGP
ncbi:hypothetical protein [Ideonella sp. BN130291]|uniref:hypothetical protein n=1 Tax=Ideonella sp. BN130291 TaxID=3112940 RepID=UPI002E25B503|nr:hypothetical protein [Ideonella sp. BN130291]